MPQTYSGSEVSVIDILPPLLETSGQLSFSTPPGLARSPLPAPNPTPPASQVASMAPPSPTAPIAPIVSLTSPPPSAVQAVGGLPNVDASEGTSRISAWYKNRFQKDTASTAAADAISQKPVVAVPAFPEVDGSITGASSTGDALMQSFGVRGGDMRAKLWKAGIAAMYAKAVKEAAKNGVVERGEVKEELAKLLPDLSGIATWIDEHKGQMVQAAQKYVDEGLRSMAGEQGLWAVCVEHVLGIV